MEIEIEADNEDEARDLVMEGNVDYNKAREIDAEITGVSGVELSSEREFTPFIDDMKIVNVNIENGKIVCKYECINHLGGNIYA